MAKVPDKFEIRVGDNYGKFETISTALNMPVDTVAQWAMQIGLDAVAANPDLIAQTIRRNFGR